jgi:pimeloyl-ACP methyl ester carboxylesterase
MPGCSITPQNLPGGWPVAPALYDREIGMQCFQDGMEKLEVADYLGFDWIGFSEHHYSYNSVAPHPAIMAAAMADRIKRAKLAILAHILPLNNTVRVAEELALLDCLTGGRLVVFGTADKVVPPAMGRTYRERMPNCHYVMVYDAGHAVAAERPEALTNTITDFLDLRETFIVSRRDSRINP